MREKGGRYGRFLGCSNWPRCDGSRGLNPDDHDKPSKPGRRMAGLGVIFPETISRAVRPKGPRPFPLSDFDPDDEETILDHSGEDRPDAGPPREP
jgi:ssDNA-binding Zn-finger/Zn-ribbon topoisomerase 1